MNCPRCSTAIVAEDVSLEHLVAKCRRCNDVFRVMPSDTVVDAWPTAKWPRPEKWVIEESAGVRRITRYWYSDAWFLWVLLCLIFGGGAIVWGVAALRREELGLALACPLPMLLLVLLGAYGTAATLVNHTVIALGDSHLEVTHGPLPIYWRRNARLPRPGIAQIYCTYATVYTKEGSNVMIGASVNVNALMDDGGQRLILNDIPREEGMFLEQQLEDWLGIVPARVPGQVE